MSSCDVAQLNDFVSSKLYIHIMVISLWRPVIINDSMTTADFTKIVTFQEVELKAKNEQADALIQIVGQETEKVSKEKEIADQVRFFVV